MNAEPPAGPLPSVSRPWAYRPLAQLAAKVDWALLIARSEPMADASLPDMRARSRPGTAMAAMMPMIATTISSSMRVKPLALRIFILLSFKKDVYAGLRVLRMLVDCLCRLHEQPRCQGSAAAMLIYKCL